MHHFSLMKINRNTSRNACIPPNAGYIITFVQELILMPLVHVVKVKSMQRSSSTFFSRWYLKIYTVVNFICKLCLSWQESLPRLQFTHIFDANRYWNTVCIACNIEILFWSLPLPIQNECYLYFSIECEESKRRRKKENVIHVSIFISIGSRSTHSTLQAYWCNPPHWEICAGI